MIDIKLRPYQVEVGRAVVDSVLHRHGLTFTVEVARQGGKNELSAQLEVLLLTLFMGRGGNLVKAAPTFRPQTLISLQRLQERLDQAGYGLFWAREQGYMVRLGKARAIFLSADKDSHVMGTTAHLLLEVDESQDVAQEKFNRDFKPMGASTNVTTVLYGTTWDDASLLETTKQQNLELERKDGVKRHFRFDWREVAKYNPTYGDYVEAERARLGEGHPLFRTQYDLETICGGGFLSPVQRAQLQGGHPRQHSPRPGEIYVAGVDLAGEAEGAADAQLRAAKPHQDSTVVTIARLDFSRASEPSIEVVEHCWWTGTPHPALYPRLVDVLRQVWNCRRIVVDSTGVGLGVASFLGKAIGGMVVPFLFTQASKSRLGFELLAAINSGRLKIYAPDGSPEFQEFWQEVERAKSFFRPNQTMNFLVDPAQGHDDFLMSLALVVEAASYTPRQARGRGTESPSEKREVRS